MGIRRLNLLLALGFTVPIMALTTACSSSEGVVLDWSAGDFQTVLDSGIRQLRSETGLTGVAVAVMTDGRLKGVAVNGERRRGTGVAVTVDDRWHAGSIAKSMTATLIAVLEHEGKLSIGAALPTLLPGIEMADGWHSCTLRHLLTHTAGAPANFPMKVLKVWPDTAEELVAARHRFIVEILGAEPESPCGKEFSYSNVGYSIVGHIAETMCGAPYEALMAQKVFIPLEMKSAGFGAPKGGKPNQEPLGHMKFLWFRFAVDPFDRHADNTPVMAPAGGVHLSIRDLARYGAVHLEGASGTVASLLPQESWQRLHTPYLEDYAHGWVRYRRREWAGGPLLWHNGSNTLWYALLMLLPAKNTVLAFATNDGATEAAEKAFVGLARQLSETIPISPERPGQPSKRTASVNDEVSADRRTDPTLEKRKSPTATVLRRRNI